MIHAYSKYYVDEAKKNLATLIDYLAYYIKLSNEEIQNVLCKSKYIKMLCDGNPLYIAGKSDIEFAELVASEFFDITKFGEYEETFQKTPEYWTGWALAEYCWYMSRDFERIFYAVSYQRILEMYHIYHEMDISHFIEDLNRYIDEGTVKTNLRIIREINELSQRELAKRSGVSIRSIQLYEQKVNDIDKAQSHTLFKLAKTLHCNIEDLLENPQNDF